jgi:L-ascorbate metabolism protein UlaG (beta-lactamase superfamily)
MDHLDIPSLRGFPKGTFGVSARDTRDLLEGTPLRQATELGWGQSTVFRCARGEVAIRAFEVRHWGRRWPSEKDRGYNGYAITVGRRKVLFAGDTAFTTRFQEMRAHGPYDLAIMPIAAYNPWIRNHCTPEEAVRMADLAGAHRIVPVHHRTFKLSEERLEEPFERIQAALSRTPDRLAVREVGEALTIA